MPTLPPGWVSSPRDIEKLVSGWAADYPRLVTVIAEPQYRGAPVQAVTVCGSSAPGKAFLSAVPHAHEPGGTAASVEFLAQLITGVGLSGEVCRFDRERFLSEASITVIPAGNPDGLSRSPYPAWEGQVDYDGFCRAMMGLAANGKSLLPWVPFFDDREARAAEIGIVYEQLGPTTYCEPNRYKGGTLWRLVERLARDRRYDHFLHLHQGMERWEEKDTWLEYPTDDWLPAEPVSYCRGWCEAVLDALEAAGASPERKTGDYTPYRTRMGWSENGQRLPWLVDWLTLAAGTPSLTVEVQNNNPRTPPAEQRAFALSTIVASVEYLLAG